MTDQPGQTPGSEPPDPDATPPAPGGYDAPPPPPPAPTPAPAPAPSYGTPPPPPSYGTPPPPPGGGYAPAPAPAAGSYGQAPAGLPPLANWGNRVLSALIDYMLPGLIAAIFYRAVPVLGVILWLAALAWGVYNQVIQGQTGQSYGKKIVGTRLISATTGQPIGGGMAVVRWIAHIIDGIPCYLGCLWPLWDSKRQTFADKIIGTYVIKL